MAMQGKLDKEKNEYRYEFKEVYYKIDELTVDLDTHREEIGIGVRGYPDKASRESEGMGIYKKVFIVPFDEFNCKSFSKEDLLTAAYKYIKTLDDFKNIKDV